MGDATVRIVIAGGGTGGHLFPALSVAKELQRRRPGAEIEFVGSKRGLEQRLVPQAGFPLFTLSLSGLKGAGFVAKIRAAIAAGWAVFRSAIRMLRKRPRLAIGVGGFASGPAVLAAKVLGVRTMVLEQNHFPGATNRWLARRVDAVCLPSDEASRHIGGRKFVTGNPVRPEFFKIGPAPGGDTLSLLVFGGSRGAHSINRAMTDALASLSRLEAPPRIVHQTGPTDEEGVGAAYREYADGRGEARAFLDDMAQRLESADLVVCRAGASTIAELAAAGRPAILIPYPYAADDHQTRNARTLEASGAAIVIPDAELDGDRLAATIAELASDRSRLAAMSRAAKTLAQPHALSRIADIAETLIRGDHVS